MKDSKQTETAAPTELTDIEFNRVANESYRLFMAGLKYKGDLVSFSRELAEHAGKNFTEVYKQFMIIE